MAAERAPRCPIHNIPMNRLGPGGRTVICPGYVGSIPTTRTIRARTSLAFPAQHSAGEASDHRPNPPCSFTALADSARNARFVCAPPPNPARPAPWGLSQDHHVVKCLRVACRFIVPGWLARDLATMCSLAAVFSFFAESLCEALKQLGEWRALLLWLQSLSFPYNPSCPALCLPLRGR
jgi:hypothetical protein